MTRGRAESRAGRARGRLVLTSTALFVLAVAVAAIWLTWHDSSHDTEQPGATAPLQVETGSRDQQGVGSEADPAAGQGAETVAQPYVQAVPQELEVTAVPTPDSVGLIVWGYVLDAEKQPIADGAYLSFTDPLGEPRRAQAGPDGSYSVSGLAPGRWYLAASARGFVDVEEAIELEPGVARVRHDLTLERRATLLVRVVTPDGRAFRDADQELHGEAYWTALIPVATVAPPATKLLNCTGDERFEAGRLRPQTGSAMPSGLGAIAELELFAPLPLFVSLLLNQEVLATQQVPVGSTEVVFTLDPLEAAQHLGDIVLTVVDEASGTPIQGAHGWIGMSGVVMSLRATGPDGRTERRRQPPGSCDVFLRAEGHASRRFWLDLAPGMRLEETIALPALVSLQGRAVDEQGQPYPAAIDVSPLPAAGEPTELRPWSFRIRRSTAADGSFELDDLGPGRWLLRLQDRRDAGSSSPVRSMSPNVVVDTRAGPITDLVVRLEPAGIAVVSWSGPDREQMKLCFIDERGLVRSAPRFWQAAPQRCALPPGQWLVRVLDSEGIVMEERTFTLGAEPVVLELGPGH